MNTPTLFYTSAQVAEKTGLPEETVRRIIRQESASFTPDEMRFIPGGRVDGKVLRIYAAIFDLVTSGHAVTRTSPAPTKLIHAVNPERKVAS